MHIHLQNYAFFTILLYSICLKNFFVAVNLPQCQQKEGYAITNEQCKLNKRLQG